MAQAVSDAKADYALGLKANKWAALRRGRARFCEGCGRRALVCHRREGAWPHRAAPRQRAGRRRSRHVRCCRVSKALGSYRSGNASERRRRERETDIRYVALRRQLAPDRIGRSGACPLGHRGPGWRLRLCTDSSSTRTPLAHARIRYRKKIAIIRRLAENILRYSPSDDSIEPEKCDVLCGAKEFSLELLLMMR